MASERRIVATQKDLALKEKQLVTAKQELLASLQPNLDGYRKALNESRLEVAHLRDNLERLRKESRDLKRTLRKRGDTARILEIPEEHEEMEVGAKEEHTPIAPILEEETSEPRHDVATVDSRNSSHLEQKPSTMVLGNTTDNTIVFKTMREYCAKSTETLQFTSTLATNLIGYFLDTYNTKTEQQQVNTEVQTAVEKAIIANVLENIPPEKTSTDEVKYTHKTGQLIQRETDNGKIIFEAQGKFSGVVTVERVDDNGNLIPTEKDVIEFENGKAIAVSTASKGRSRINMGNLSIFKKEAAQLVSTKINPLKTEISKSSVPHKTRSTPKALRSRL